jgi:hypothetical protein
VVLAQDAAAAGQRVFAQLPGRLVLAAVKNDGGEVAGGGQGAGVSADPTQADGQAVGGAQVRAPECPVRMARAAVCSDAADRPGK